MSWPFAKRIESTIPPDGDGISPDVAVETVYGLTLFSLGDEDVALIVTIEVVSFLAEHWELELNNGGSTDPLEMRNKPKLNRAMEIIRFTHDELEYYKKKSIEADDVDNQTMIVWYVEENVFHALGHNAAYVAALPYVLFTYKPDDVCKLYTLLNPNKALESQAICHLKKNFHDHFMTGTVRNPKHWLGEYLTPKGAKRTGFVAQPLTGEIFQLLVDTLERLTPPGLPLQIPDEVIQGTFKINELDLEDLIRQQVNSDSDHAMERARMRFLMHTPFLFGVLKAMGLEPPEEKADIPAFRLKNRGGSPPINRNNLPPLNQGRREVIRKGLGKRKMGRGPLSRKLLVAEVRGENRLTIPLDESRRGEIRLNPGESVIKLKCRDRKGCHPLDVHFISWSEAADEQEPQKFVTVLEDGGKVELNVSLNTNLAGNPTGALVRVAYSCEPSRQTVAGWVGSAAAGFARRAQLTANNLSHSWREQFAAYATAALSALGAVVFLASYLSGGGAALRLAGPSNTGGAAPAVAELSPVRGRRNIGRPRESKDEKLSPAGVGEDARAAAEDGLFLYAEAGEEMAGSGGGGDKWHVAVKRRPRRTAASVKNVSVSVVDPATGEDVAVGSSEDGKVALPLVQAGLYEVTVNRRGVNFSRTVELPLDAGTYVELKKDTTPRKANR